MVQADALITLGGVYSVRFNAYFGIVTEEALAIMAGLFWDLGEMPRTR